MKINLPNYRFLGILSDSAGQDWMEKVLEIDDSLEQSAFELAEEGVYLVFQKDRTCLVARSVVGPLKEVSGPLKLLDTHSGPGEETLLASESWNEILEVVDSQEEFPFMIKLSRKLSDKLDLKVFLVRLFQAL